MRVFRARQARSGLARWLTPPAAEWRRKSRGLLASGLTAPLAGLAGVALTLVVLAVAQGWRDPAGLGGVHAALAVAAVLALGLLIARLHRNLLVPLTHLRYWALRAQGGNLAARIPEPRGGEFAQLARDVNGVADSLESLSRSLEQQVSRQTARIAQKTRSLEILYDVAASINVSRDTHDLLARFLHTLREVVGARAGAVRLLTDDEQMELVASVGLDPEVIEHERLVSVNSCTCGSAAVHGTVRCDGDVTQCAEQIGRPLFERSDLQVVAVPLEYRDRVLGVYNLFVPPPGLTAREDLKELLTSIGRHLGMAVEKARLDEEARRYALIQERNMLAHELHDSLAQTLASLRLQVRMLADDDAQDGLASVREGLDTAYAELRELLAHFRAPIDQRGLLPAVQDTVARFRHETGIPVFLHTEWEHAALPASLEMQVLRIVQEALANVRKHADANGVRVMLRCDAEGNYRVLVEDDGVGHQIRPAERARGEQLGLQIMRERARQLGGELSIESEPGEGTRVAVAFQRSGDAGGTARTTEGVRLARVANR